MPQKPSSPESQGKTVALSKDEEREVRERSNPRAAVVFETVRREGEVESSRPAIALAFSGLACGLSMGLSLAGSGVLLAALPAAPWRPLVVNFGYTLGFLVAVLGRQQLFTENTLTAILPVLDDSDKGKKLVAVVRLWGIVLFTNLLGAGLFAYCIARSGMFPSQRQTRDRLKMSQIYDRDDGGGGANLNHDRRECGSRATRDPREPKERDDEQLERHEQLEKMRSRIFIGLPDERALGDTDPKRREEAGGDQQRHESARPFQKGKHR
ncbi:MAG: formate/nitrite transporter family protein [Candidatus Tyrphobacter sp.]